MNSSINVNQCKDQHKNLSINQLKDTYAAKQVLINNNSTTINHESQVSASTPFYLNHRSLSSTSGGDSNSSQSLDTIIRDFKSHINERQTPQSLHILNRLIIFILLVTMMLTCVHFSNMEIDIDNFRGESEHNLKSERRTLELVELASNVRSMINVGNGIGFNLYEIESLNKIEDRLELVSKFV